MCNVSQCVCEKAVSTMNAVLRRTLASALGECVCVHVFRSHSTCFDPSHVSLHIEKSGGEKPTPEQIELRLIQSKRDIENPPPLSSLLTDTA